MTIKSSLLDLAVAFSKFGTVLYHVTSDSGVKFDLIFVFFSCPRFLFTM